MLFKMTAILAAGAALVATPAVAADVGPETGAIDVSTVSDKTPDAEFSELFASWEGLENGGRVTSSGNIVLPETRSAVLIPQRVPVDGVTLTSGFGMRDHPILRQRRRHNGIDLAATRGTPVYATADGIVEMAQYYSSYGNYVQIEHAGDIETRYAHLASYTVNEGEFVQIGDLIGYVGSTGRSTGPHLHYEVRVAGDPVNPIPYMVANVDVDDDERAARGGPD